MLCRTILLNNLSRTLTSRYYYYQKERTLMNVKAWVELYDQKQLRSPLTTVLDSGVVEPADRRELVRIAVAGMVEFNEGNL